MKKELEDRIDELFDELVPVRGKADTEAGEVARAYTRLAYRWFNDGDKLGVGYGNETCNAAGRYLLKHSRNDEEIGDLLTYMWGQQFDSKYDELIDALGWAVIRLLDENGDMRQNDTEDMWSHFDNIKDVDYEEEDEWGGEDDWQE